MCKFEQQHRGYLLARAVCNCMATGLVALGGHPDNPYAWMVFDGCYRSVFYHGHEITELFDHTQDPWNSTTPGSRQATRPASCS